MKIKNLELTGMRAFRHAKFEFQPGMNLLVGVNGVGKTTVLDALRICLSRVLPQIISKYSSISLPLSGLKQAFGISDIKIGFDTLQVSCDFEIEAKSFNLLQVRQRESIIENKPGSPRDSVFELSDIEKITPALSNILPKENDKNDIPLGLFFSTKRSIITDRVASSYSKVGGIGAAFADSLSDNRDFNLRIFADWFKVQEALAEERPIGLKHIAVLREAVELFLPGFKNLRVEEIEGKSIFMIEKNGTSLNLSQLSDGERGVLSIVLDLARRLSQANPTLSNPLAKGTAIVLIDELDLHLHPQWQRTIVVNLTRTFPNCQFIVSTHSPQIIGEVERERITIIDKKIYTPSGSFGIDSSRLLEEILDTPARNKDVDKMLNILSRLIDDSNLNEAKTQLSKLSKILGINDPDIVRSTTMISFLESDLSDETD